MTPLFRDIRELLQRKRFRLRKRNYENEFAFFQTLSRLFQLAQNAKRGLEFAETAPMRKKNLSWYVYILHKTSTEKNLTSWPCMGGKEMYKKLFCTWKIDDRTYSFFEVLVAVTVFVACLSITGADKTESPCRVLEQTNIKFPLV